MQCFTQAHFPTASTSVGFPWAILVKPEPVSRTNLHCFASQSLHIETDSSVQEVISKKKPS